FGRHSPLLRPRCSRSSARATFATSSRKSTFGMGADFADNRPIVGKGVGTTVGTIEGGSTRDRIALKRRQRNDLVGFELFFRSQMLYPTELRAHRKHFTVNSLRQVLLRFQPRVSAHSGHL